MRLHLNSHSVAELHWRPSFCPALYDLDRVLRQHRHPPLGFRDSTVIAAPFTWVAHRKRYVTPPRAPRL
jgi:hypothetical protein